MSQEEFNAVSQKISRLDEALKKQLTHKLAGQLIVIIKKNSADAPFLNGLKNPEDVFKHIDILETSDSEILITFHVSKKSRKSRSPGGKSTSRQAKALLRMGYRYREPGRYVAKSMTWIMQHLSFEKAGVIINSMQEKLGINPQSARKRDFIAVDRKKLLGEFLYRQVPDINAFLNDEINQALA
jgi:hypothetical protein